MGFSNLWEAGGVAALFLVLAVVILGATGELPSGRQLAGRWRRRFGITDREVLGLLGVDPDRAPPLDDVVELRRVCHCPICRSAPPAEQAPMTAGPGARAGRAPALVPFLGVALDPDVGAFMGGLETAVTAGFVLVVALVVVHAIKRFTSF